MIVGLLCFHQRGGNASLYLVGHRLTWLWAAIRTIWDRQDMMVESFFCNAFFYSLNINYCRASFRRRKPVNIVSHIIPLKSVETRYINFNQC